MSTDAAVTKSIMKTLEDGREGFEKAAERLASSDDAALAEQFRTFSQQRAKFSAELETMAKEYGDDIDEDGSVAGAIHRGWLAVKDALSGSDASGILDAAEQGEDHAVEQYEKALKEDISPGLRTVLERQFTDVKAAHDTVRDLRNRH